MWIRGGLRARPVVGGQDRMTGSRDEDRGVRPSVLTRAPWTQLQPLWLWAGMLLLVIGFIGNALWHDVALKPTLLLGALALASVLAAWVLRWLLRCHFATALLMVWLVALVCAAGLATSAAVGLIALGALAIGGGMVPREWPGRAALALLAGLALMVGVVGWTLPFRIHYLRETYTVGLILLVGWRWRSIVELLRPVPGAWSEAVAKSPLAAGLAVVVLGVASTGAWLPTILFDDLAYHLGLPSQLVALGYYQMAVGSNVWALAGWSADVLHGIAWVVAGAESRGAVDALWFALSGVLLWRLCAALELKPSLRWLALALFASLPELAYTLASMQTEGPTIAVMLGLALLIQRSGRPDAAELRVVAVLFGLLLGLKVSNLWFALPLGGWLLWQWRARLPWGALPGAVLLAVIVMGSSYVYAWALTGNPVLPVFNGVFHSPYFAPVNYYDSRWHSGFGWDIIWRLAFHSSRFIEGGSSAAPLFLIGLGGCFFVALFRPRSRALALVAAAALLLPLSTIQYLRYATPGLVLLVPVVLSGMPDDGATAWRRRAQTGAAWLLVPLMLLFVSSVCWQFKYGALHTLLSKGDAGVFAQFAPTRLIAERIRTHGNAYTRTLMLDPAAPFAAGLAGKAFANVWYDPVLSGLAGTPDPQEDGAKWTRMFDLTGANRLVTSSGNMNPGLAAAIVRADGTLDYSAGGESLWVLHPGQPGVARAAAKHGLAVTFATADAPAHQTLVHGELELACNPQEAAKGHIVVGWTLVKANGQRLSRYGWAPCTPDGHARAVLDLAVRHRITGFSVLVQPDPVMDMGLQLVASRGSLRNDLTARRDLARRARHSLAFWKTHRRRAGAGA